MYCFLLLRGTLRVLYVLLLEHYLLANISVLTTGYYVTATPF